MLKRALHVLSLALACLIAASPATASDPTLAGFEHSDAMPIGEVWSLPPGITIDEPVLGHSLFIENDCTIDPDEVKGSGDMVMLCLTLRSQASTPVAVVIPSGLIFVSEQRRTQNGMVIKRVAVDIAPGEILRIPLGLMCINVSRSGSAIGDAYRIGPITQNPAFRRFFDMLENKSVPTTAQKHDPFVIAALQDAVFDLAAGKPLSQQALAAINALPNE